MTWREKLKDTLKERGITQSDLAEMMDVSKASVMHMVNSDLKISVLARIAEALDVPLAYFFEEDAPIKEEVYDEEYRRTHVHGYLRIGERIVEITSMQELRDAVIACEVNYLK